jgi:hypothetical protein
MEKRSASTGNNFFSRNRVNSFFIDRICGLKSHYFECKSDFSKRFGSEYTVPVAPTPQVNIIRNYLPCPLPMTNDLTPFTVCVFLNYNLKHLKSLFLTEQQRFVRETNCLFQYYRILIQSRLETH